MTLIKICGITREEDAALATTLGADFLGFIFVEESPRYVSPERVRAMTSFLGSARPLSRPSGTLSPQAGRGGGSGFVYEGAESDLRHIAPLAPLAGRGVGGEGRPRRVGVFRNTSIDEIHRVAEIAQLDLVQLHGEESEEDVRAIALPVIKAYNVKDALPETSTGAAYVMFDTGGGTGRAFDWTLLDRYPRTRPFFLAGGITPDTVEEALRAKPDAIDLASGIERAPGIKDHDLMKRLFERVRP